jgi:hypothetical protein
MTIRKMLQLCPVSVPMWGVWWDDEEGFMTIPVIALALSDIDGEDEFGPYINPICFSPDYIDNSHEDDINFLGYSLTAEPKKEHWGDEIERCRDKNAKRKEKMK